MSSNGNHQAQSLLTLEQFRVLLQASESTVRRIIRSGEIPVFRHGGMIRIHPDEVEKFIKRNTERQK